MHKKYKNKNVNIFEIMYIFIATPLLTIIIVNNGCEKTQK